MKEGGDGAANSHKRELIEAMEWFRMKFNAKLRRFGLWNQRKFRFRYRFQLKAAGCRRRLQIAGSLSLDSGHQFSQGEAADRHGA